MRLIGTTLVLCFTALAQDTVRSTINGWIEKSQVLPFANNNTTEQAVGRVRALATVAEDTLELHRDLDGKRVVVLRATAPGAAAVRLHFEDFRLPAGAKVLVYGWSAEKGVTRVLSYQDSGPLKSGEFWTLAVPGHQAVIELQFEATVDTLPFRVSEIAAADGIDESALSFGYQEARELETRYGTFRGMPVAYQVVDGMAVWEGDILLGRPEELAPSGKQYERNAGSISGSTYRWPNGVVPYVIDAAMANQARIADAVNHWNTNLSGYVRLIPRTTETAYIRFAVAAPGTCSSYVGYYRYAGQPVNIGDYCSTGNVIHEIGHALGLYHEHTRSDRDTYVRIQTQNADPASITNFNMVSNSLNPTAYDYNSIMHYGTHAFSVNGQPTIVTKPDGIYIGQRSSLSANDIAGVKIMYPAATTPPVAPPAPVPPPSATPVRITILSNPAGRQVTADGTTYTTPANFDWLPGSQHTLVAAASEVSAGARYSFVGWNDGAPASRTYTVPSSAATLTETFQVQYQLVTRAGVGGSVFAWPVSVDGYYAVGTNVTISAAPQDAYCLTSWSGVLPVSTLSVNVQIASAMNVQASFATGALNVTPWTLNTPSAGGQFTANLTTGSACTWSVASRTSWITVESPSAGTGSAPIQLRVQPNTTGRVRSGIVIVSQRAMIVRQN